MDWEAIRDDFPITRNLNFQNHAAVAPMPRRATDAMKRYVSHCESYAYVGGDFFKRVEQIRQQAARLINAKPDEVTFIKNTSEGISMVANGLTWRDGDNVVSTNVEFPANVYPWQALAARGVQLRAAIEENGRIPLDRLVELIDDRTRVVAISSIQFASGFRTDLEALGRHCKEKGVFLCVDAIQSLGVQPIDVEAMHIDFLAADAHKWLCGPEGIGVFFVRKDVQGYLRPTTIGWASMKNMLDFSNYQFEFHDDARRYDSGAYNLPGIYALGGCLELLLELGIPNIESRVLHLTDRLVTGLREKGYRIVSSREKGEASAIVAFISGAHNHEALRIRLENEHRIIIATRCGRLRASPHFYNSTAEIDQLIEALPAH
jgi:selenocysteine lyase/cysteine desulfurase